MKNNYLKLRPKSFLDKEPSIWKTLLYIGFLILFAHLSTYAQPCNPSLALTITTIDATSATANNAKIRISGLSNNSYRVGFNAGAAYTGDFTAATVWSSLDSGYVSKTLASPAAAPGDQYTARIYNVDGSCFTDTTFYLPYVNWNYTPEYVDIQVAITRSPSGDVPMGANFTVTVAVQNNGSVTATGVEFTTAYATGLTFVNHTTAAGTYSDISKIWNIGTIAAGATVSLEMTFTVDTRGIKEITAENTALDQIDLDSSPTNNTLPEDDQGQICVTTHMDYCFGDEFTFAIANGDYNGIIWERSTDNGATWATITGNTAAYEVTASNGLIIKTTGDYRYTRLAATGFCAFDGCCPVKVIPGLPPILTTPNQEVICFGDASPVIESTNTQDGYTPTTHTTYGITTPLPPFLSDQGSFRYQWFNNNGVSNPTLDSLTTQNTLTLGTYPTAVGRYNYRLVSVQNGHETCADTVEVEFIINELPIPVATINSPICQEDTIFFSAINTAANPTPGLVWSWQVPALPLGVTAFNDSLGNIPNAQPVNAGQYIVTAAYNLNGLGCSNTDTVDLVVNLLPIKPTPVDTTYCEDLPVVRLSAFGTGTNLLYWYDPPYTATSVATDTTAGGYNVGPIPPNTFGVSVYHIRQVDLNGCVSHDTTLTVTVKAKPLPPLVADVAFCEGGPSDPLTAVANVGDYDLIWYGLNASINPGDTNATHPAPPTDVVGQFRYFVSQFSSDPGQQCQSDTVGFDVYIKSTPVAPYVEDRTYCLNDATNPLVATAATVVPQHGTAPNFLTWYSEGVSSPTQAPHFTNLAGATWMYVTQSSVYDTLICESAQAPLRILVNPLPLASVIPVSALCLGDSSLNNGMLILTRYRDSDQVSWNIGSLYNAATPTAFANVAADGIFASSLPNPTGASQDYSTRIQNAFGCTIDVTVPLNFKDCTCPGGYCEPATITRNP